MPLVMIYSLNHDDIKNLNLCSIDTMNTIAKSIKAKLQKKGLSVHALERLAGLKPSSIHNILQGKSKNPTLYTLQAISQALDCPLNELVEQKTVEKKKLLETWNAQLYQDATQVVNQISANRYINLTKEQAIAYIEEVYNYTLHSKKTEVDRTFAEWLLTKQWL